MEDDKVVSHGSLPNYVKYLMRWSLAADLNITLGEHLRMIDTYQEAQQFLESALHIREQSLGPEHPDVAFPLNGLANLYYDQGKYAQAKPLYQRALHIREQSMEPEHPHTQKVRANYASLLRKMERNTQRNG